MTKKRPLPQSVQFVAGFLIPTVILLTLSDESKLGPLYGMLLSLAFPVAIELYSLLTGRKASYLSLFAIIGILTVGAISLFGLNEEWLAARRAAFYIVTGLGIVGIARFKPALVTKGIGFVLDIKTVLQAAKQKDAEALLLANLRTVTYAFGAALLAIGAWSYIFTILFISAPTGTSEFNAQYAELRVVSLAAVTLPFMVITIALLMYLLSRIEKLTSLGSEDLLKKK